MRPIDFWGLFFGIAVEHALYAECPLCGKFENKITRRDGERHWKWHFVPGTMSLCRNSGKVDERFRKKETAV